MAKFRDVKTLQKFSSVHAWIHNHFNLERHLIRCETFKKIVPPRWPNGVSLPHEPVVPRHFGDWFALD